MYVRKNKSSTSITRKRWKKQIYIQDTFCFKKNSTIPREVMRFSTSVFTRVFTAASSLDLCLILWLSAQLVITWIVPFQGPEGLKGIKGDQGYAGEKVSAAYDFRAWLPVAARYALKWTNSYKISTIFTFGLCNTHSTYLRLTANVVIVTPLTKVLNAIHHREMLDCPASPVRQAIWARKVSKDRKVDLGHWETKVKKEELVQKDLLGHLVLQVCP